MKGINLIRLFTKILFIIIYLRISNTYFLFDEFTIKYRYNNNTYIHLFQTFMRQDYRNDIHH